MLRTSKSAGPETVYLLSCEGDGEGEGESNSIPSKSAKGEWLLPIIGQRIFYNISYWILTRLLARALTAEPLFTLGGPIPIIGVIGALYSKYQEN